MQIKKTVCDRCGKEIFNCFNLKDVAARINFWNVGAPRSASGQKIDLCPKCCDEFIRFLEGKVDE